MASKRELEARIGGLQRQVNAQQAIIERIAAELDMPITAPTAQPPVQANARADQLPKLPPASVEALASGNKILAIKLLREESYPSLSLKDAKDIVEAYEKGPGGALGPGSAWA